MSESSNNRPFVPDEEQRAIIEAAPDDFLLVTAPPGAGKTAVACARIVELVRAGIEASNIMMLSFTRVAVGEFRDRIRAIAKDDDRVEGVEITTLDSSAWRVLKGMDQEKDVDELFGDYDSNISEYLRHLREGNEILIDRLGNLQHLLVDEAQDLTGIRAEFVLELIRFLRSHGTGVTVFADPAQAIYGFTCTDEEERVDDRSQLFLQMLEESDLEPTRARITTIHRTDSENLRKLFLGARATLEGESAVPSDDYDAARAVIEENVDETIQGYVSENPQVYADQDRLILYRRRFEVLMDSSYLSNEGIEHRMRLSGYPHVIEPWIGAILGRWIEPALSEAELLSLWEEKSHLQAVECSGRTAEEAWQLLLSMPVVRRGRIEMRRLRQTLSRRRPPLEVASPILGSRGPILGTIHAAKGTEARHVTLMLPEPPAPDTQTDHVEEARVLYVGATRAIESLQVGRGNRIGCGTLEKSQRIWRGDGRKKSSAQVEIGREGDLDLISPVAHTLFDDEAMATENQERLAGCAHKTVSLRAQQNPSQDWRYELVETDGDETPIAYLSQAINTDLFSIPKAMGKGLNPPKDIRYLYTVGCTTVCIPEDDVNLDAIQEPYCESGIYLAPVIKGLTKAYFRTRRSW